MILCVYITNMITATVLADSLNEKTGDRLTTLSLRFHRFILPEFNTHRVFSRNAQSSRAIPVNKVIQTVIDDPAIPVHWGKNIPGMSANEELSAPVKLEFVLPKGDSFDSVDLGHLSSKEAWLQARDAAVTVARAFSEAGYHKQIVNRLIEPFCWTTMVVSSTEWANFFEQRISDSAQPEIKELAIKIKEALDNSEPRALKLGEWHLPYILNEEKHLPINVQKKISVARCARVSYKVFDTGVTSEVNKDVELHNRLRDELHLSPFEHVAELVNDENYFQRANFKGFIQYRSYIEEEMRFAKEIN